MTRKTDDPFMVSVTKRAAGQAAAVPPHDLPLPMTLGGGGSFTQKAEPV